MDGTELRERGRRAFDLREWREAYEHLAAARTAGGNTVDPEDSERLAIAAYLTGRYSESTDAWALAHQGWLARSNHARAVGCAFWAASGLVQRGDMAQGGGWLARGWTLVDQHALDCVERGYLVLAEGLMAIATGDLGNALDQFREVIELARRFDDLDLTALGAMGRGEALLRTGQALEGMRLLDEAMVSVTAGETTPVVSGIVYCAVINVCQQASDLRRAREWTAALDRWCARQPDLVPYRGQCLVHRAQILQAAGEWNEAMTEAQRACDRLAQPPHPAIGMAHYEVGELHRLRGELTAAEAAYRRAHAAGREPHPGLALLRLAEGRIDAAVAAIRRAVHDANDDVARAQLLPGFVEIMLAAEQTADARWAAEELHELAQTTGREVLHAMALQARGAVLVAEGEPRAALDDLKAACRAWQEMEVPYEAARARVLMAAACQAVGDVDGATLERDAARAVFRRLGANLALAGVEELVAPSSGHGTLRVTAREVEVLRLVAGGATNREIARVLSISERTVERHLGNIFTKIAVPNRAAATAYAYDHGLV